MTTLTLLASLAVLVICAIIAVLFSKKTAKPIEEVLLAIKDNATVHDMQTNTRTDNIANIIQYLSDHNEHLNEELYRSLPIMREEFLRRITQSTSTSTEDYSQMLRILDLKLPTQALYLALLDIEDYQASSNTAEEVILNQSLIMLVTQYLAEAGYSSVSYSYDVNTIVILFDIQANATDNIFEIFDTVQSRLSSVLNAYPSFIVCEQPESIYTINKAYSKCQDMLKFKSLYSKGSIITCLDDHPEEQTSLASYPIELENQLIAAIQKLDINGAVILLDKILNSIYQIHSLFYVQTLVGNFTNRLSSLLREQGHNPNEVLPLSEVHDLILLDTYMDDLKDFMIKLFEAAIKVLDSSEQSRTHQYFHEIHDYIKNHYGEDLSLTDISNTFFLSKNYVNTIIRNHTDMTFVQLLTQIRIDAACDLLTKQEFTVNEIAAKTGFASSRYFIQVFKKHLGITPGQYSEIK